jgi:glucose-1-phosphatase
VVQEIKNIIFDLGGVLINLDYGATREAFIRLGFTDFDNVYSQAQQNGLFDALDKGTLSPAEFRDKIRTYIDRSVTDKEIDDAWNAMLLDVPAERLELLKRLKEKYRLFLLSNTNTIHVERFSAELQRVHGTPDFTPYFEKWYYSCNIGMRKPDAEIFLHVLNENNLRAEETVFIDDSVQHIVAAQALGIRTVFLEKGQSPAQSLRDSGIAV